MTEQRPRVTRQRGFRRLADAGRPLSARHLSLAGLVAIVVVALIWAGLSRVPASDREAVAPITASAPSFPPAPATRTAPEIPVAAMEEEIARLGARPPARINGTRLAWAEAENLAALAQYLLPQAIRGDGASQYLIYLSLETCRGYLQLDTESAEAQNEQILASLGTIGHEEQAYWQREFERCRGFADGAAAGIAEGLDDARPSSLTDVAALWFERAVESRHPPAMADWALRPRQQTPAERLELLHVALAARDADVYWMLFAHGGKAEPGGADPVTVAWLLVACRVGYECREQARWFRTLACLQADRPCPPGQSALAHYWHRLPEPERGQAYRLAAEIEQALDAGAWQQLPLPALH